MTPSQIDRRISNLAIHNLSSVPLSFSQTKLLGLGHKYIPRPPPMAVDDILKEYAYFSRLCRLRMFFRLSANDDTYNPFRLPNPSWEPPINDRNLNRALQLGLSILKTRIASVQFTTRPRFSRSQLLALKSLRRLPIVIKPADKNLGIVVLDRDSYVAEAHRQLADLNVYRQYAVVPWLAISRSLRQLQARFHNLLSVQQWEYILQVKPQVAKACRLYFIWKIHKNPPVGRPICAYNGFMLEPLSKFLHYKLLPTLLVQPNHLPDSLSLLQDVESKRFAPDSFLVTFDVESLYPSIPTQEGLHALRDMVEHSTADFFTPEDVDFIVSAAELVLKWHFLQFDGSFYRQIRGTAMGSNFAVVYACLFLCHLEQEVFRRFPAPEIQLFRRFIDDGCMVWNGSRERLVQFLDCYQSIYPEHIRITSCISSSSINILDLVLFKGDDFHTSGKLSTRCFQKPLNAYQYIPFTSWHPKHQKVAFVVNELQRYLLRESTELGFLELRRAFYSRLRSRGYPPDFLQACFAKVHWDQRVALLQQVYARGPLHSLGLKRAPLVLKLDFCEATRALNLGGALNPKLHGEFQRHPLLQHIPKPMICWRNPRKIGTFYMSSSDPRP